MYETPPGTLAPRPSRDPAVVHLFSRPVFRPLGDAAFRIQLGEGIDESLHRRVRSLDLLLSRSAPGGVTEWVPSYATVTVFFDPRRTSLDRLRPLLEEMVAGADDVTLPPARTVVLPVRYGGAWGPDLEAVASLHGMSADEVVEEHCRPTYRVYLIGFSPGFPYLGGLSERLATPRLETPRLSVPAGSVAIGGSQTGVYPIETPGGWRILGRTPIRLFDLARPAPNLLDAGDRVRFRPIGEEEYREIEEGQGGTP